MISLVPRLPGAAVALAVWFPAGAGSQVGRNIAFCQANDVRRLAVKLLASHAVGSCVTAAREAR